MRYFVNLTNNAVGQDISDRAHLTSGWITKRGTNESVEIQFHIDGIPALLAAGSVILFGCKAAGQFDGAYLTSTNAFTAPTDASGFYTATLPTNTAGINTLLGSPDGITSNDVASIPTTTCEIEFWTNGTSSLPRKSQTFSVRIDNTPNNGNEAPAAAGASLGYAAVRLQQIAAPAAPTVTAQGTAGSAYWSYSVVAVMADGTTTDRSDTGTCSNGALTLTATDCNKIAWSAVSGAASYNVYRQQTPGGASPATVGKIGSTTGTQFFDTGLPAAGDPPTVNGTGGVYLANGYMIYGVGATLRIRRPDSTEFTLAQSAVQQISATSGTVALAAGTTVAVITAPPTGVLTLTLPAASGYDLGRALSVLDFGGYSSTGTPVRLTPYYTDTLNGGTGPVSVLTGRGKALAYADGSGAWIV